MDELSLEKGSHSLIAREQRSRFLSSVFWEGGVVGGVEWLLENAGGGHQGWTCSETQGQDIQGRQLLRCLPKMPTSRNSGSHVITSVGCPGNLLLIHKRQKGWDVPPEIRLQTLFNLFIRSEKHQRICEHIFNTHTYMHVPTPVPSLQ